MEIFFDIKFRILMILLILRLILHKKKSLKESIKFIFNPKVFFSKSATSDYKVFFINQVIMIYNTNNKHYIFSSLVF